MTRDELKFAYRVCKGVMPPTADAFADCVLSAICDKVKELNEEMIDILTEEAYMFFGEINYKEFKNAFRTGLALGLECNKRIYYSSEKK